MTDAAGADSFRSPFRTEDGIEVIVGHATRMDLARRVLADREPVSAAALDLMLAFLHSSFTENRRAFDLDSIEIFAERSPERGDFSLRYFYSDEAQEFGYTYFDVFFTANALPSKPYWPFRFAIGFH